MKVHLNYYFFLNEIKLILSKWFLKEIYLLFMSRVLRTIHVESNMKGCKNK